MTRCLAVAFLLLFSNVAVAQGSSADIEKNIQLLKQSDDFRVRTQAALSLGASADGRATAPLCSALSDGNRTVRIASATGLSRLRKGGSECLAQRLPLETDSAVLSALHRAIDRLGGVSAEPMIGPATRIFVAIDKTAGPARLNGPVRAALVKGALSRSDVAFAPAGQTIEEAAALLKKFPSTKAFLLSPRLSKPVYEGGMLQVKISVAILSYPGKSLLGSFSKSAGMSGISGTNEDAENELVLMVAEESMKQFLTIASSLDP